MWYDYDGFGNLAVRKDNMRDLEEIFTYDHLNRLTGITLNGSPTGDMGYDPYGRMKNKVSDNAFVFSAAVYDWTSKPHAIDAAKTRPGVFPDERQRITYTCFDKVKTIEEDGKTLEYAYGHDRQRTGMTERANGVVRTKRYAGRCEFVTRTEGDSTSRVIYTFLTAPTGVFAVVNQRDGNRPGMHYVLKDHLGSWTTITDARGRVEREQSFDAWGNMRDPDTWTGTVTQQPMFDRGYTGHEHLNTFGLINMNGRMYDPVMSSFLSVDNYVQCPDFSQNFNRYAYCLNNPLKYIDPSGEELCTLAVLGISAAIGAAVSMASTAAINFVYDRPLYEGLGRAAIVGALQGAFSFGIGSAASVVSAAVTSATNSAVWGTVAQVGFQALAHGMLAGTASEMRKEGSFWSGFASGAAASLISGAVGGVCDLKNVPAVWTKTAMIAAGGLGGGVSSLIAGGEFIDGLCNGLICAGLNHALHYVASNTLGPDDPPTPAEMKERVKNLVKAQLSLKLSFSSKALFDEKSGHWMGKNGKFYSMKWGGNKYTGGKYKFAQKTANVLKGTGYAISVYQGGKALYDYAQGNMSSSELAGELGFNILTTVTGDIGAAVSVGRALSGVILSTEWYQEFKFNVNYGIMEHKIGTPNESNQIQWMNFINNYK